MAKTKKIDDELKLASEARKTATDNLNNMSYDNFKQGSMYQGLQKDYAQQGQQAMKDTLGQVAARTGGMASSYATSAANQSYNNYMRQLEDVARAMYNDEYSKARDKVSLAQGEYDRLYGESRDAVADQRYEDEWAYQKGRDSLDDQRYEQEKRDAELKAIFGAEDFTWGDWDGDGVVEGEGEAKTFDDIYGGSSHGEDYWKAYAEEAAKQYSDAKTSEMAADFQEFIGSGMNFEEAVRRIGGVYNSNHDQIRLRDGTLISPKELTGHTAEYWNTLHRTLTTAPAEEQTEFKGVSGSDFDTYYRYFLNIKPGDETAAAELVNSIIAATGNEDLAFSLYGLWVSQGLTGKG